MSLEERLRFQRRIQRRPPAWTLIAERVLLALADKQSRPRAALSLADNLASPVVDFASRELGRAQSGSFHKVLSPAARRAFEDALRKRLSWSATQLTEGEASVHVEQQPNSSKQLSASVHDVARLFQSGLEPATLRFVKKYPALLRLWSRQVENWWSFICDFVDHLESFLAVQSSPEMGAVRRLETDLSDPHNGNRTVLRVHFSNGAIWFYKPRSGKPELGWFRLLGRLNTAGFPAPFKLLRVVTGEDHCWMEAVEARAVCSLNQATAFYFRAGSILYLAHVLRAVDLHAGNIIACGDQPILIDCETILHPETRLPKALRRHAVDVMRTGLLPLVVKDTNAEEVSAFGRLAPGDHLLRIKGRTMPAREFTDSLQLGFQAMHDFLQRHRIAPAVIRRLVLAPACQMTRRLYRPTSMYARLMYHSCLAPHMKDGLLRSMFLQVSCSAGLAPRCCLREEVRALEDGDIPIFLGRPAANRKCLSKRSVNRSLSLVRSALTSS